MTADDRDAHRDGRGALIDRLLPPVNPLGEDGAPKPSRMTPREQLVAAGLGLANVAITAGTASAVHRQQLFVLLAGLLASALTLVGARAGHRIIAMLGLFAATLARPSSATIFLVIILPYYAAAMWIFLKFNRLTKEQGPLRRQQRSERRSTNGATPRSGRTQVNGGSGPSSAKAIPTKSKRYTPPKPPKRRPPPPSKPPRDRSIVD